VKVIREIQLIRGAHEISSNGASMFIPQLLEVIVPEGQAEEEAKDSGSLQHVFLVMEHEESDLRKVIKMGSQSSLTESHVKLILYNMLCALKSLHLGNIIHRDLKPGNVLINKDCQIKICDFGLSRTLPESCLGSGSGNTTRVRNSLHRYQLTDDKTRDLIYKKLKSEKETS
jgi:serine/threonine protein kinase